MFDSHIYDSLAADPETRLGVARKIALGHFQVVASPIVVDELNDSPFKRAPDFFPVVHVTEAVAVVGYARVGLARLGIGKVYEAHRGQSQKSKDAIIAETAESDCGLFVSNDKRCRERLRKIAIKCRVMDYAEFKEWQKST